MREFTRDVFINIFRIRNLDTFSQYLVALPLSNVKQLQQRNQSESLPMNTHWISVNSVIYVIESPYDSSWKSCYGFMKRFRMSVLLVSKVIKETWNFSCFDYFLFLVSETEIAGADGQVCFNKLSITNRYKEACVWSFNILKSRTSQRKAQLH